MKGMKLLGISTGLDTPSSYELQLTEGRFTGSEFSISGFTHDPDTLTMTYDFTPHNICIDGVMYSPEKDPKPNDIDEIGPDYNSTIAAIVEEMVNNALIGFMENELMLMSLESSNKEG